MSPVYTLPLYLTKGVYCMPHYSSFEPNSPTPLRVLQPDCKLGAFGSASRQPAQLPGPDEPASMARLGVFGEAPREKGAPDEDVFHVYWH